MSGLTLGLVCGSAQVGKIGSPTAISDVMLCEQLEFQIFSLSQGRISESVWRIVSGMETI